MSGAQLRLGARPDPPMVWAIGGGKGGVGKSVIAANLAVLVARGGERVALLDADLGGANLHTLLGMASPARTLSDFLARRCATLDEVVLQTPSPNLSLISAAHALYRAANPNYAQKAKLLRHIGTLEVDHVFLDLGAGSSFNVLDFFLAARRGVLVVVPEPTSVENGYQFIRAVLFRKLSQLGPRERIGPVFKRIMAEDGNAAACSPWQLIGRVSEEAPELGETLRHAAGALNPGIVVNAAGTPADRRLADDMATACREHFGVDAIGLGAVDDDPLVSRSIVERRPAVELFPESPFALSLRRIAAHFAATPGVGRA